MAAGRRRTDAPDGLWSEAPAEGLSDHPTAPGRNRGASGRAPVGAATPDVPRQISRSRLPLPPVPVAAAGPRTSAAPFRAVPAPELPGGPAGDGPLPAAAGRRDHAARIAGKAGIPVLPRPAREWADDEPELVSTGPGLSASGARASGPAPRLPRQTTPAGSPSPAYGDWTKPSRSGDARPEHPSAPVGHVGRGLAPATTAIPERPANRRESAIESDDVLDSGAFDAPRSEELPVRGPGTGPVSGGRAAMRAERQAADMARRKAARRSGAPVGVPDDEAPRSRPKRVLLGLVAMTVVALGVLGVYTVVSPQAQEASSRSSATQSTAPSVPTDTAVLPPLETQPVTIDIAPATPVLAPVTVLNATEINGLAADVAAVIAAGGWETPGVGGYVNGDVAASTVFFTEGDETQRQAAVALVDQFPQLAGPAPRFFELPPDVAAPGLVVVLTAPWAP